MITHAKILAALAELRTTAEAATPGPWHWTGDYPEGHCPHDTQWTDHGPDLEAPNDTYVITSGGYDASDITVSDADAAYIATWNPAFTLGLLSWAEQVAAEHAETAHRCDGGVFDWAVCGPMRRLAGALGLEET